VPDRAPAGASAPPSAASWSGRAGLAAALAALCAIAFAFVRQPGISSVFDDSVSYLTLARFYSGLDAPWALHYTWFPPLFPLLLAAIGGGTHFARAHVFVAACAMAALPLVYRHAARRFGRPDAALLAVVLFELTATAWVSIQSILSEPTFLLVTMASLVFFEARLVATPRDRDRWIFGLMMAAALLTRVAGVFLVVAYVAHLGVRWLRRAGRPGAIALVPLVPPMVLALAWRLLRPMQGADDYDRATSAVVHGWLTRAPEVVGPAVKTLFEGWVASFAGGSDVAAVTAIVLAIVAILALAGTALRVRSNALDGWYVAIMLLAVFALYVNEDTTRRYLYPILPLLLVNAGIAIAALARRLPRRVGAAFAALAVGAPILVCLPAFALLAQKALDRRPVLEGFPVRYSDMTAYYTTVDLARARRLAATHAAVISGFGAVASVTPADAKVMWVRPEYVALLSRRAAEPWYYGWDERTLARHIRDSGVGYVAESALYKADFARALTDPGPIHDAVARYAVPVLRIPNPVVPEDEFVLMRVDRGALSAFLAGPAR